MDNSAPQCPCDNHQSNRIIHDVKLVFENLLKVHEAKGKKDVSLAKRKGHQWEPGKGERRGGHRTKKLYEAPTLHPDTVLGRKVKLETSEKKFLNLSE